MIVSLLQLMGFPSTKPVHSRAGETTAAKPAKSKASAANHKETAQAAPARRQEVKAKSGKDVKSKGVKPKDAKTKDAKSKVSVKTAVKKVVAAPKVVKAAAKPAVKPSGKAVAKPPAKVPPKPVAKTVAKAPVKAKAAPKPAAKPVAKPIAKPVTKSTAKPASKAAPLTAVKAPVKAAAPASAPSKVAKSVVPAPVKAVAKPAPVVVKAAPVAAPVLVAAPVAAKTGRPSARLAQLTVPSMAQAVASTAAKASYSQTMPTPVIVLPVPSAIKKDAKLANNWKSKPVAELTDAELLAMPDSEYMNDVQLAAFKLKLSVLKRDILNSAGETTEHLREDTSVVPDPADRATIEEEHALELRTRDRERKLLKKIEQSIVRIDAGDYGYCDETGEPIGVGRLLARPTATLSLEAQQRRELKQKMFGD